MTRARTALVVATSIRRPRPAAQQSKSRGQVREGRRAYVSRPNLLHPRSTKSAVRVDISYMGVTAQTGGVDLSAMQTAVAEFGQTMVSSGATLITFLAIILPWIPLVALLAWA